MSQYPVQDEAGLYEAVNYLLSGPSGLGQNFNGFSSYQPVYLTGTFRQPYSVVTTATTNPPLWYVAPIAINSVTSLNVVNGQTANLQWTFTTPQATPPFNVGLTVRGRGFVDTSSAGDFFDGSQGYVLSCSTTSVITQFSNAYSIPTITSYGTLRFDNNDVVTSSDANARVTVQGPTELVFISSQLGLTVGVHSSTSTGSVAVSVQINRYSGSIDTSGPGAVDYLFNFDKTVSEQVNTYAVTTATTTINAGQNIFTTVLDTPGFGYYWYIAEVTVTSSDITYIQPTTVTAGLRSLTVQVIKQ
jgi:hypothetical protein